MDRDLAIVLILIFVVGVPFTLWWWKMADRWADTEHKRFKPRGPATPVEKVIIRDPGRDNGGPGPDRRAGA